MLAAITKLVLLAGFPLATRRGQEETLTTGRVCLQQMRQAALAETSRFLNDALTR